MRVEDRNTYHIFTTGFVGAEERQEQCDGQKHRLDKVEAIIPYMKELGINTVLFGPLFQSTSHGYDTIDYRMVDKRIGTNEELKALIEKLHENGMEVLFDCVFNHVGRDHFAVQDLLKNRENARYKDWFCDVNFGGNNYFNDGLWYADWAGCADLVKLNLYNPEVRDYLKENVKFWIDEFGIDGVRLDAANVMAPDFLAELSDYAKSVKPEFFLFGEIVGGDYANFMRNGHLDSCTNYECYKGQYSSLNDKNYFEIAHSIRRLMGEGGVAGGYPLSNFVDNHDVERVASTLRDERLLVPLYTLLYAMPGYPTIYYESEQGIKGKKGQGTDAPLRPPYEAMHFDTSSALFKHIKKLGAARKASKALRYGKYQEGFIRSEQYGFSKEADGERVYVVLNMNENAQNCPMNLHGQFVDILTGEKLDLDGDVPVEAFSGRILFEEDQAPVIEEETEETVVEEGVPEDETPEEEPFDAEHVQKEISAALDRECALIEKTLKHAMEALEKEAPVDAEVQERIEKAIEKEMSGLGREKKKADKSGDGFAPKMKAFMDEAILEARKALMEGEVPVGAVVVKDGEIIARAHNQKESLNDPTAHAEILALREAAAALKDWRLEGCELYVTAEPCPMCMGAVLQTRLKKLVYGTPEYRYGAVENSVRLKDHEMKPKKLEIYGGIREDECKTLLGDFFRK